MLPHPWQKKKKKIKVKDEARGGTKLTLPVLLGFIFYVKAPCVLQWLTQGKRHGFGKIKKEKKSIMMILHDVSLPAGADPK